VPQTNDLSFFTPMVLNGKVFSAPNIRITALDNKVRQDRWHWATEHKSPSSELIPNQQQRATHEIPDEWDRVTDRKRFPEPGWVHF